MENKAVAVMGSTGSIGTQALDVIRRQGYMVVALGANTNTALLEEQALEHRPRFVAVRDEVAGEAFRKAMAEKLPGLVVFTGLNAPAEAVRECGADVVLNAIVGIAGLSTTLAALQQGTDVALANKESLVAGGELVTHMAREKGARLLPVDSEHSAIFQCLQDPYSARGLKRILLTASGGPFYGKTSAELCEVTREDALRHPNWAMGAKITIDSATMMNKGLELIEAMWLFGLPPAKIDIVVQRESIIHSMVEFSDHSVLAQLGVPDMRIPIQYALTWPERAQGIAPRLDFTALQSLSFGMVDEETFRCLAACKQAAEMGGLAPCAANGANEEAVKLFLAGEIGFLDIGRLVEACVNQDSYSGTYDLQDVYACDENSRRFVREQAAKR